MATPRTSLHRWIGEFCAPVVVTVTSAEVEKISLKNSLLFHDLLSAFSHLDAISSTIRTNGNNINMKEGHIRFESASEVFPKSSANIEEACLNYFEQYDLESLPVTVSELKSNPPSALTSTLENVILRSGSFQDFDMLSHPIIIMTVVSSSEPNPLQKLQELAQQHQFIPGISLGLYDPEITRIYVLLHDVADTPDHINPAEIFAEMKSFYPYHAKILRMNSLSDKNPNLQQPDWWSRWVLPKFFINNQSAGYDDSPIVINPDTGAIVLGSRLGIEDFMLLREFVVDLFEKDIVPALERRLTLLNRAVSDSKKGMKNVFKNFWRKPREDTPPTSPGRGESGVAMTLNVRYKYDRPELQTLYLADLSFCLKDYETAASLYRLVKDDFKSDKSILHHAQCTLNLAVSLCLQESGKQSNIREIHHQLENLTAILSQPFEPVHMYAYFSILMADLYALTRSPIDSTQAVIIATEYLLPKGMPLLGALLREKTSQYFLVAGQMRKLAFNQVLAGLDFFNIGGKALKQSTVCFAAAAMLFESGPWGEIKLKLFKALVSELKHRGLDGAKRCLLLQFRILDTIASDVVDTKGHVASAEAVNVLREILGGKEEWHNSLGIDALKTSHIELKDGWRTCDIRCALVGDIPLQLREQTQQEILMQNDSVPISTIEVSSLVVPNIDSQTSVFLYPLNGSKTAVTSVLPSSIPCSTLFGVSQVGSLENCGGIGCCGNLDLMLSEYYRIMLAEEKSWVADQLIAQDVIDNADKQQLLSMMSKETNSQNNLDMLAAQSGADTLAEQIASIEYDIENGMGGINGKMRSGGDDFMISIGEAVRVKFKVINNLPINLCVKNITLEVEVQDADGKFIADTSSYTSQSVNIDLTPHEKASMVLFFKPIIEGTFRVVRVRWSLNEQSLDSSIGTSTSGLTLVGQKSLLREGALLQKTLKQRAERIRAPGSYLKVCVGPPQPLLQISLDVGQNNKDEGIVLLQGQFQHGDLVVKNEGGAPACNLDMMISGTFLAMEKQVDESCNDDITGGDTKATMLLDGHYMRPIGPSGLGYEFPSSIVVAPGETRRFKVCVRIEQGGRQTMTLFMGYSKLGEQVSLRRDSFVSFNFYVCASLVLSARITPKSSDVSKRIVIIDMKSYLDPDDRKQEDGSNEQRSTETLYIAENKDTNTLHEGQIQIESVALIGVLKADEMASTMTKVIQPSEKLSLFLEVDILSSPIDGSNRFDLGSDVTWIIPSPNTSNTTTTTSASSANSTSQLEYTSNVDLPNLLEHFTCLESSGRKYTSDLQMARDAKRKEMADAEQEGPRTIAAVRRENREEGKHEQRAVVSTDEEKREKEVGGKLWVPRTFTDIALQEKNNGRIGGAVSGGACLVVSWVARWRGRTRRGVHILHDIPALASAPVSVTLKHINNSYLGVDNSAPRSRAMSITDGGNATSQNMDKFLSVSINGPKRMTIPAGSKSCIANVTLDIVSTSSFPLKFSVEASEKSFMTSTYLSSSTDNDNSGFEKPLDNKGIRWLGKTKFSDIIIHPFSSIQLQFAASLSKHGIFDLKRFKLSVHVNDETDGGNDSNKDVNDITERSYKSTSKGEAILKDIQGNCYVEVMKE